MSTSLLWNNALNWALQVTLLAAFAWLATRVFQMQSAHMRLRWYQTVLAVVLLLPALVPPTRKIVMVDIGTSAGVTVVTGAARPVAGGYSGFEFAMVYVALGLLVRLLWLGTGFIRLSHYKRSSSPLFPSSSWSSEADIRVSPSITGPVTFGVLRPVVLLPTNFTALKQTQQDAILCHEIMHVRRRDWLWMLGEELVRSALWFHPAIWWLTAEIRLAREQAVDAEVVAMMRTRDEYVDALLTFANVVPTPFAAPVPGFIRRHHLKQRVINILKEVHMSRTRTVSTTLAASAALAAAAWFTTTALPLMAEPQLVSDSPGITINVNGPVLQHRTPVITGNVQVPGTVTAEVRLDDSGNVADARILSGPDELRKAVLQSVLGWHFAKSTGATQQVTVNFQPQAVTAVRGGLAPAGSLTPAVTASAPLISRVIKQIDIQGLPEASKQELAASLPVHAGDTMTAEAALKLPLAARKFDEHLNMTLQGQGNDGVSITLSLQNLTQTTINPQAAAPAVPNAVRVGGNVAQANLVKQEKPIYPPLAKAARVQGTVQFEVMIDKEGRVSNLRLLSGPPLLVQAAMQAVQQWVYRPTLLNGNPVDVVTTIDINFTLPQEPTPAQ